MRKYLTTLLAAAAGMIALGGLAGTASAGPAARHQTHYGNSVVMARHLEHRNFGVRHIERHRHFRRGPVLYFNSGVHNDCYWLKRRALNTGSRYWWHRYQECRNG
jgi:hypothetical protein